jgi:sec-independent protein translocase protein TatB
MNLGLSPGFTQPLSLVILALFAFLVLGPKRFPEVARTAGQWLREARTGLSSQAADEPPNEPVAEVSPPRSQHRDLDTIR